MIGILNLIKRNLLINLFSQVNMDRLKFLKLEIHLFGQLSYNKINKIFQIQRAFQYCLPNKIKSGKTVIDLVTSKFKIKFH